MILNLKLLLASLMVYFNFSFSSFYINNHDRVMYMDKIKSEFEFACIAHKVEFIILDHLDFLYDKSSKNSFALLEMTIQLLHELALKYKVGIILIAHPKQIQGPVREITFNDFKGGSCIRQLSDNIIILTRKDLINPEEKGKTIVSLVKNRELGKIGRFDLKFNYRSGVFYDMETHSTFKPYKEEPEDFFNISETDL